MNFYPPGFYYLASLLNLVFNDWIYTLFAASILGFALSGLAFYLLAREFYSRLASVAGALLYMTLPYHVLNLYWQGAMPQLYGFVFLPLVLLFAYRLGASGGLRHYAALGLVYGLYLMTHAPVSFLMTYTIAFYALVWAIKVREWRVLLRIGLGMALGLMAGAIYWLPAAFETKYIQEHFSAIFPYHSSYITLLPAEGFGNLINLSFTLQAVIVIIAILVLRRLMKPSNVTPVEIDAAESARQTQTPLWMILGVVTILMSTSFSIYVSRLLPRIQVATFAWRWLAIAALFTSLLACATMDYMRGPVKLAPVRAWGYRAALAAAIALNIWVSVESVMAGALANPVMIPPANYSDAGFTPLGSTEPQAMPSTELALIEPRSGEVEVLRWEPERREVAVSAREPSEVRLRTYNFRGWSASINGQGAPISNDGDGAQLISVPPGKHLIEVRLENTPPQKLGTTLFGFALGTIAGLAMADYLSRRRSKAIDEKKSLIAPLKSRYALFALLLAAVVGVIALLATSNRESTGTATGRSTAPTGDAPARGSLSVGSEARVAAGNRDTIMIAVDQKAMDEMVAALSTVDDNRLQSLVDSGRVFTVLNNTKVRVLESELGKVKVRVLEGESVVMEGWVPDRWIR
jgi:hypothetical protein